MLTQRSHRSLRHCCCFFPLPEREVILWKSSVREGGEEEEELGGGSMRRSLQPTQVAQVVQLIQDGTSMRAVARRFAVSVSVVSRAWRRYQETGQYIRRRGGGRRRATTQQQDRYRRLRSPDLNPIEHIWDIMSRSIHQHHVAPQTVQELADALVQARTTFVPKARGLASFSCILYSLRLIPAKDGPAAPEDRLSVCQRPCEERNAMLRRVPKTVSSAT
ncbi:hypothetical protein L3Q82_004294 [Scortum barcoo]|uniref:Uncharacterized protein n=1 Tax=Scortum barcoo TaxID=214431 RepID=A0ACB8VJQ1_9TELE|nr:hypothetical protein L3Q82_004294 [Scortum barcoo]